MAEEPQIYPSTTPQQIPPASQPTAYALQQYAPQMPITPTPGKPVRKKRGGSAALVFLLGGCGVLALVFIVAVSYFAMNLGSTISNSTSGLPNAQHNLEQIRGALDDYTKAHEGRYPPSLDEIVEADALVYTSKKGEKVHVEYTRPTENSASDAGVAGFFLSDMMKYGQLVEQKLYVRLLKNGSVVQEQITRSPLPGQGM